MEINPEKPENPEIIENPKETSPKKPLPENLDINALKAKMEALQKLLAPRKDNFEELLAQNKLETSKINKILKETETVVSNIDKTCEKGIKRDFQDYKSLSKENQPTSYKKFLKKIKKLKNQEDKEHVESLISRINVNERRIEGLKKFMDTGVKSVIIDNFEFIEESLREENIMSEHYLDYVFKQSL